MTRLRCLNKILPLLCLFFITINMVAQTEHILVIDKTMSMIGQGDGLNRNIWPNVKTALSNYIHHDIELKDKVSIYQFDAMVTNPQKFLIGQDNQRDDVVLFIENMNPTGQRTGIYNALNIVVGSLNKNDGYIHTIVLFTDGHDNCSNVTMQQIAGAFRAKRGPKDFIYYISLGVDVPNDVTAITQNDPTIKSVTQPDSIKIETKIILEKVIIEDYHEDE